MTERSAASSVFKAARNTPYSWSAKKFGVAGGPSLGRHDAHFPKTISAFCTHILESRSVEFRTCRTADAGVTVAVRPNTSAIGRAYKKVYKATAIAVWIRS